jgi:hypothetical protein
MTFVGPYEEQFRLTPPLKSSKNVAAVEKIGKVVAGNKGRNS